jgi:hypothetical protein
MEKAGESWSGLPNATWADMLDAAPEPPNHVVGSLWDQLVVLSGYHITRPPTPDSEFVRVCNGDLRKMVELMQRTPPPQSRAVSIAPGWKLVPEEPTPDMVGAWYRYKSGLRFPDEPPATDTSDYGAYRAMLAASPQPVDREPVNSGESGDKSQ